MKQLIAALLLAASTTCAAQEMPSVIPPMDPVNLRLHLAAEEMGKAAWSRNTSAWWLLCGGLFTVIASDKSASAYDPNLTYGLGAITAAGFVTFTIKGSRHDRRAAAALRHQ